MKANTVWRHAAVSVIAAGPVGGFLFGILHAGDPDPNPIGRIVYAFMMAVVTPLHAGFPPHQGASVNVWAYIGFAGLLVFLGFIYRDWKSSRREMNHEA